MVKERKATFLKTQKKMFNHMVTIWDNKKIFSETTQKAIGIALENMRNDVFTKHKDRLDFNKAKNFLLSQKLSNETGLRDLTLRYITVILQICVKLLDTEYSSKLIYEILKSVMPSHIAINGLGIETIPKYVNNIDVNNKNQCYQTTFLPMQAYEIMDSQKEMKQEKVSNSLQLPPYYNMSNQEIKYLCEAMSKEVSKNIEDIEEHRFFDWFGYYQEWKKSTAFIPYQRFINSKGTIYKI